MPDFSLKMLVLDRFGSPILENGEAVSVSTALGNFLSLVVGKLKEPLRSKLRKLLWNIEVGLKTELTLPECVLVLRALSRLDQRGSEVFKFIQEEILKYFEEELRRIFLSNETSEGMERENVCSIISAASFLLKRKDVFGNMAGLVDLVLSDEFEVFCKGMKCSCLDKAYRKVRLAFLNAFIVV